MRLTKEDIKLAREGYRALLATKKTKSQPALSASRNLKAKSEKTEQKHQPSRDRIVLKTDESEVSLPPAAVEAITTVLAQIADGNEVTITVTPQELTTQQAADFLNVSRPFLINLLEKGGIPFHKVGTHRRIKFSDVQRYKNDIDGKRLMVLVELAKEAQELNMGY